MVVDRPHMRTQLGYLGASIPFMHDRSRQVPCGKGAAEPPICPFMERLCKARPSCALKSRDESARRAIVDVAIVNAAYRIPPVSVVIDAFGASPLLRETVMREKKSHSSVSHPGHRVRKMHRGHVACLRGFCLYLAAHRAHQPS